MKTRALIHLTGGAEDVSLINRLALTFDEINVVLPQAYSFTEDALRNPKVISRSSDGNFIVNLEHFNFFDHVEKGWARVLDRKTDSALLDAITCFKEAGILNEVSEHDLLVKGGIDTSVRELSISLIGDVLGDEVFELLSGTTQAQYDLAQHTTLVTFAALSGEENDLQVPFVTPPNLVADVDLLTTSVMLAGKHKFSPIFSNYRYRLELDFLYGKYLLGLQRLKGRFPQLSNISDVRLRYGQVASDLVNEVVSSESLSSKSPYEVLKFRNALESSRKSFLSSNIAEVEKLVGDRPWSADAAIEIEKYVQGHLRKAIAEYEIRSQAVWRSMYGKLSVSAASAARNIVLGGAPLATSAITGVVAPGTSLWGLLVVAAVGLAKEAPKAVGALVDGLNEDRANAASSVSYIAGLARL